MKTRFTLDLKVFSLILKELRAIKREIQDSKKTQSAAQKKPVVRDLKDKVYSKDVMRLLRITNATLVKYEKLGFVKFHREGRTKVYSEAEVLAFKKMKGKRKRIGKGFGAAGK